MTERGGPTAPPSSSSDPTANWKTYTDGVFGYSIKYPEDWECNVIGEPLYNYGSLVTFRPQQDNSSVIKEMKDVGIINVGVNRSDKSLDSWIKDFYCLKPEDCIQPIIDTTLDGQLAKKVYSASDSALTTEAIVVKIDKPNDTQVMYKSLFYTLTLNHVGGYDPFRTITLEERKIIFDEMVSTFKFTQ